MSDVTLCDGPECNYQRKPSQTGSWLTLKGWQDDKHFHNVVCLKRWAEDKR